MKHLIITVVSAAMFLTACDNTATSVASTDNTQPTDTTQTIGAKNTIADAATIMSRPQVPVLCYHHIRPYKASESMNMKSYSVSPENFAAQMKALHDSGYHTVLPNQLYEYLAFGKPLPEKPVMLTFDDTDLEQFTFGAAEMKKYNFKGVFFIMTIAIGRPRYMSREQLKELADDGHAIEGHTWDHHMVTKYEAADWDKQLDGAHKTIETITGKKVNYFAYPFGIWNRESAEEIKNRNITMAFQLSTKRDSTAPLYTVRRMIVPGTWSTEGMMKTMKTTFSH